ncbi:hypothetical protein K439DRAFT_1252582, partial [Ramaria rubella]
EILDEITKLRYERNLPSDIINTIIREYQLWKGSNFVPKHVHAALHWSNEDPFPLLEVAEDTDWYIHNELTDGNVVKHNNTQNKKGKFSHIAHVVAQGSKSLLYLSHDLGKNIVTKKTKKDHPPPHRQENPGPLGVQRNSATSSCAYDSLITIMHSLWKQNYNLTYNNYAFHNRHWQLLHSSFQEVENGTIT